MAKVIAGVGTSHVPSIGSAYDLGEQDAPNWKPLFEGYKPAMKWLKEAKADIAIVIYNDHGTDFFLDRYPTFAMGARDSYPIGDEGWGHRPLPPVPGDLDFAWHMAESLVIESEFDMTICQDLVLDHGFLAPMPLLWEPQPDWSGLKVLPIAVNVLQHPLPTAKRLWDLGQALRKGVESYKTDERVVVVGTGGLSHQLHGEQFGLMNEKWDNEFLDMMEGDPAPLLKMHHDEWMERGGAESVEMIMWLAMRGALSKDVKKIHRNYYLPMLTGMGLTVIEDTETPAFEGSKAA